MVLAKIINFIVPGAFIHLLFNRPHTCKDFELGHRRIVSTHPQSFSALQNTAEPEVKEKGSNFNSLNEARCTIECIKLVNLCDQNTFYFDGVSTKRPLWNSMFSIKYSPLLVMWHLRLTVVLEVNFQP